MRLYQHFKTSLHCGRKTRILLVIQHCKNVLFDLILFQMFNYENHSIESILDCSSKIITFIDLAGSHKYLKTTVFGLTGHCPDYAALVVNSKQGLGSCYYLYIVMAVFTGRVAVLVVLQY